MKRLLVCVLLVGVVGCGESEQVAQSNANLTACPDCEKEVSKRATACPHCGAPLTEHASSSKPARPGVPRLNPQPAVQGGNTQPRTVDKAIVNGIGMKMTLIPPGEFMMGSPDGDAMAAWIKDYPDIPYPAESEEPQHRVKITRPFYLAVHEVTQQQYEKVMGARPWQRTTSVREGPDYPAVYVSHNDAVGFCRRLSEQEGLEYRLPTEAEWEYACRAGTTTVYSFGDDASKLRQYAWYDKNAWDIDEKYPHRVGQKLPNPWGLYDMHGNIYEWCQDWYLPYGTEKVVSDPKGPAQGERRVLRDGAVHSPPSIIRSASRKSSRPGSRNHNRGFRVARTYSVSP
jgi:sulfatase modifying factor 1